MARIAVFPGSFDPIHNGHVDIIKKALPLFDKIIVAIGINSQKQYMFDLERRLHWIKETFADESKIEVKSYGGLTVQFCEQAGAQFIIRGLRSSADFEFEKAIGNMNHAMYPAVETVFFLSTPVYTHVASVIIRDIIANGGNIRSFVPDVIKI